jgi:hypothetical protein
VSARQAGHVSDIQTGFGITLNDRSVLPHRSSLPACTIAESRARSDAHIARPRTGTEQPGVPSNAVR